MTVDKGGYPPENIPAQTLGDSFRTTRMAARVSVEQVEADLRIKAKYIEAIEDSDPASLPSRAYTDGFLRNYATYLGMDPAEAVQRFAAENGLQTTNARVAPASPLPTSKKSSPSAPAPRRGVLGSMGRMVAALGPVVLVAGLTFGGYTGYVAARDAGLIPAELGEIANSFTGEERVVADASIDDPAKVNDVTPSKAPSADTEQGADVEAVKVDTASKARTEIVGNESTTGRPGSLSYAKKGNVPYWEAKPPAVEPTDGPVADIKPETAGLLRARAQTDESRWTASAGQERAPADVDASRIAAAARAALFASSQPSLTNSVASENASTAQAAEAQTTTPTPSVVAEAPTIETQPVEAAPITEVRTAELTPQFGIGPVVTETPAPAELAPPAEPGPAPRRFALVAVADTWVQVTNSLGTVTYTGILSPGEAYNIPVEEGLRLKTGNAGGLFIEVEGQQFGPLGSNGAVMRNVTLNPGAVRASFTLSQASVLGQ